MYTYSSQQTIPIAWPVSLAEAKLHLRVDAPDADTLIQVYIEAATQSAELYLRRVLMDSEWVFYYDSFPGNDEPIEIPYGPILEMQRLDYIDPTTNVLTQFTQITAELVNGPSADKSLIRLLPGKNWPATTSDSNAVAVSVRLGYGAIGEAVPSAIKQAILMLVGHFYANRESTVFEKGNAVELPQGAKWLLSPYRAFEFK